MWKNRILYLILSILLAYFCVMYNRRDTALIFLMVLVFPWVSAAMIPIYSKRIRIKFLVEQPIVMKGEECKVRVHVWNESIWPISKIEIPFTYGISTMENTKQKLLVLAIAGKGKQELELEFQSDYVGNIHFYIEKYWIWDFCKCTRIRKKLFTYTEIMVMPEEHTLKETIHTGGWNPSENESIFLPKPGSDQTEILNIREYMEGDSVTKIHWKLTSKWDKLMVKEYASILYYLPLAVLDLRWLDGEATMDDLDTIYETFVSFAAWHISEKQPLRAAYYDIKQQSLVGNTIWSRDDLIHFLHNSYENIYRADTSRSIEYLYSSNEMYRHSNIIYFTSDLKQDSTLLEKMQVFCCYIVNDVMEEEELRIYHSFASGSFHMVHTEQREEDIMKMAVAYVNQNRGEYHES